MKNLIAIIAFLCSGAGMILVFGLILACMLPEEWAGYIGTIIAIPFGIALIVMFIKFVANVADFFRGKW